MTRNIRIAIVAAVLGVATAALAGPPDAARVISPTVPLQGTMETPAPPRIDVRVPPYQLTGSPARTSEPSEWRWTSQTLGNVHRTVAER